MAVISQIIGGSANPVSAVIQSVPVSLAMTWLSVCFLYNGKH